MRIYTQLKTQRVGHSQPEQGLVEGSCEEGVQQVLVHERQPQHPAAEAEPLMLVVDEGGHRGDLHGVRVVGRVLEQAVVRVEQLTRQQEEELTGRPTVVQPAKQHTNVNEICSSMNMAQISLK